MLRSAIAAGVLVGLGIPAHAPAFGGEPVAEITAADAGVMLIRQTTLYRAATGAMLQNGDIIETPDGSAQIEIAPSTLLALAAHSRVLLRLAPGNLPDCDIAIYSLAGMLKVARAEPSANRWICLQAAPVRAMLASGSAIQHTEESAVSLFAEAGELTLEEDVGAGALPTRVRVPNEQFAQWRSGGKLSVLPRPTPEFLAAVPAYFQDELTPMAARMGSARPEPVAVREVSNRDIADWLKVVPERAAFARQFHRREPEVQGESGRGAEVPKQSLNDEATQAGLPH